MLGCDKKPRRMVGVLRHWQIPAHSPHGVQADIFGRAIFPDGSGGGLVESPPQPTGYEPATAHGWFGTHPRVTACVSPLGTGFSVARRVALGKSEKDTQKMERNEIRCGNCGKLLGKGTALDFEIKCPRCKAINHLRASDSPCSETPEAPSERNHARKH